MNKQSQQNSMSPDQIKAVWDQAVSLGYTGAPNDVSQLLSWISDMRLNIDQLQNNMSQLETFMNQREDQAQKLLQMQDSQGFDIMKNKKSFCLNDFKKIAQQENIFDDFDIQEDIEPIGDSLEDSLEDPMEDSSNYENENIVFENPQDIIDYIKSNDMLQVRNFLLENTTSGSSERIAEAVEQISMTEDPSDLSKLAIVIYDSLVPHVKSEKSDEELTIEGVEREQDPFTNPVTAFIKNYAEKYAKEIKNNKLDKNAQHKSLQNTLMWGPDNTRFDIFYRQPVSDYHIIERNKGFGGEIDGVWNIDWEAIWRGFVMDKYSQSYKDKDGNWVGGYLNKRFEVDSYIPEGNDAQLKPGEKRKPIIPELGNTESRMQAMRNKKDKEFSYNNEDKPTDWNNDNWAEIKTCSFNLKDFKKKIAYRVNTENGIPELPELKLPGEKNSKVSREFRCPDGGFAAPDGVCPDGTRPQPTARIFKKAPPKKGDPDSAFLGKKKMLNNKTVLSKKIEYVDDTLHSDEGLHKEQLRNGKYDLSINDTAESLGL